MAINERDVIRLFIAIRHNNHDDQKEFLGRQRWVEIPDPGGRTALTWAMIFGDRLTTRRIIKACSKKALNVLDKQGCTALHYATMEGRTDVVKSLLQKGAQVNTQDKVGMTPLHYGAQTLNEFMIKLLVVRGKAKKVVLDHFKRLPYHVAVQWGSNPNILELLEPDNFELRKATILQIPHELSEIESTPIESIFMVDKNDEHLQKWVLTAKHYATHIEKARCRDHVVNKIKKEMEHHIQGEEIALVQMNTNQEKEANQTLSNDGKRSKDGTIRGLHGNAQEHTQTHKKCPKCCNSFLHLIKARGVCGKEEKLSVKQRATRLANTLNKELNKQPSDDLDHYIMVPSQSSRIQQRTYPRKSLRRKTLVHSSPLSRSSSSSQSPSMTRGQSSLRLSRRSKSSSRSSHRSKSTTPRSHLRSSSTTRSSSRSSSQAHKSRHEG